MNIDKLLADPLINNGEIAKQLGITRQAFNDKLHARPYLNSVRRFTDKDRQKIKEILSKLFSQNT